MKKYLLKSAWFLCCIFISCEMDISDFHKKSFIADTHNDVLLRSMTGKNILSNLSESHSDFEKFDEGGVDLQVFSIWVSPTEFEGEYFDRANNMITHLEYLCSRVPSKWSIPYNYQDIIYNEQRDILSCMIGVEGGHAIEKDLLKLEKLYDRGMRYLGVTWNNSNDWATSAKDETQKRDSLEFIGLSEFGKEVIRKCNDLGIMIDISHAGDQTVKDILQISNKPIIASHSSVYNICPHYRNLKDDQMYAIKKNGGVIFINFYPGYIDPTFVEKEEKMKKFQKPLIDSVNAIYGENTDEGWYKVSEELAPHYQSIVPDLDDVVDHIDYVKNLIGIDHVGIGGDWDGVEVLPKNIDHIGKLPALTKVLIDRGYTKKEIRKILGENFKRVFKEVL
ncbi:MAG: membrane dipeptidase [Candidatus Neomarinimicrobiota bacterium]|nr:MAG: membrane dipeptidase [Candidatus Neomarinimicrobiota bacterium]